MIKNRKRYILIKLKTAINQYIFTNDNNKRKRFINLQLLKRRIVCVSLNNTSNIYAVKMSESINKLSVTSLRTERYE